MESHRADGLAEVVDHVLDARPVLSKRDICPHRSRRAPVTVREESRPPVVEESSHFGILHGLLEHEPVARRVLLGCDGRCHVDEPVVAVLAGECQHHPVPLALQMSSINCNNLTEGRRCRNRERIHYVILEKTLQYGSVRMDT